MALQFMEGFGGYDIASHDDDAGDAMKLNWNQYDAVTLTAYESGTNGVRLYATGSLTSNMVPRISSEGFAPFSAELRRPLGAQEPGISKENRSRTTVGSLVASE